MSHSSDRAGTGRLPGCLNLLAWWTWKQPSSPKHTASGTSCSKVRAAGLAGQHMASVFNFVGLPLLSMVPTCISSPSFAKVSLIVGREPRISLRLSNGECVTYCCFGASGSFWSRDSDLVALSGGRHPVLGMAQMALVVHAARVLSARPGERPASGREIAMMQRCHLGALQLSRACHKYCLCQE